MGIKGVRVSAFLIWGFVAVMIFYLSSLSLYGAKGDAFINIKSIGYHMGVFFFFTIFLLISVAGKNKKGLILLVLLIGILYGISDEFHQSFVPGRAFTLLDIFVDSLGVLLAGVVYLTSERLKTH